MIKILLGPVKSFVSILLCVYTVNCTSQVCFQSVININSGSNPISLTSADFNGDGIMDLANNNKDSVFILLGDGKGYFEQPKSFNSGTTVISLTNADFNGDGNVDIACNYNKGVSILLGDGAGNLGMPSYYIASYSGFLKAADFNNDGNLDIIGTADPDSVFIILGDGKGKFGSSKSYYLGVINSSPRSIDCADYNYDGNIDIAVANYNTHNITVMYGDGAGGFISSPSHYSVGKYPKSVISSDFNSDGYLDLATANSGTNVLGTNNVSILLGNGLGVFNAPKNYVVGGERPRPNYINAVDINGDGIDDLVTANSGTKDVSILIGDGVSGFRKPANFSVDGTTQVVVCADFNMDGNMDVATANQSDSPSLSILLGCYEISEDTDNDLCGLWMTSDYQCDSIPLGGNFPELFYYDEVIEIEQFGSEIIATKVIGDNCVNKGQITWQGIYDSFSFNVTVTKGNSSFPNSFLDSIGGNNITVFDSTHLVLNPGQIRFTKANCKQIDSLGLNYYSQNTCDNCPVKIEAPNVFSPNNDGINDIFLPELDDNLVSFELSIYNRWGVVVFKSNDPNVGWDGMLESGNKGKDGVYYWTITSINTLNESSIYKGFLSLIN